MRKRLRIRKGATNMMLLNDPSSGVPLVHNAANLEHFFSPASVYGNRTLTDLRGNVSNTLHELEGEYRVENNMVLMDNQLSVGNEGVFTGDWAQFSITDDCLIVLSGQLADDLPGDDLRLRIGGGDAGGTVNWIRVRSQKSLPLGDTVYDENGEVINNAIRLPHTIDIPVILISAMDRTNNLWHTVMIDDTGETDNVQTDITGAGAINPSNVNETASPIAPGGRWYGCGVWKFPNKGLPSDWYDASLLMANAWRAGNYTFWNPWGTE